MTAQQTLRAALHPVHFEMIEDDPRVMSAILEAMQQHRAEGLEEVIKVLDTHRYPTINVEAFKNYLLAALKSLRAGGE